MPGPISVPMTPFLPKVLTLTPQSGSISESVVKAVIHGLNSPPGEPAERFHFGFTLYGSAVPTDNFAALNTKLTGTGGWIANIINAINANFTATKITYKDICRPQAPAVSINYTTGGGIATTAAPSNMVATVGFGTPFTARGKGRISIGPLSQADISGSSIITGVTGPPATGLVKFGALFGSASSGVYTFTDSASTTWQLVLSTSGGNLPSNPLLPARPGWTNMVRKSQQKLRFNYATASWQPPITGNEIVILEPVTSVVCDSIVSSRNSRQSRGRKVSRHQVPDNVARAYKVARVIQDQRLQNLQGTLSQEEYLQSLLRNEGQLPSIRGGARLLEMNPE